MPSPTVLCGLVCVASLLFVHFGRPTSLLVLVGF